MRRKLVVGNWKMNGALAQNEGLLRAIVAAPQSSASLAVCVPFPYLAQAKDLLSGSSVAWGAQDVSVHRGGAYTGDVAASMIRDFDCRYVIVGHSERRAFHAEDDVLVVAKANAAIDAGIVPIVCVGESLQQHERGQTADVVLAQVDALLEGCNVAALSGIVIAYEPVWAIGTGLTATPGQAQAVHAMIRSRIAAVDMAAAAEVQILYGGSVKPGNAGELFAEPDIDGGLVGGASLSAEEFLAIARSV